MYTTQTLGLLSLILSLVFFGLPVTAQDSYLWVQGGLEDATATDDTYNSGGTVVVNGFSMTVPKNVLVQFPSAWVPFKDFVASKDSFIGFETFVCAIKQIESSSSLFSDKDVLGPR